MRGLGLVNNIADIENIAVATVNGTPIRISDVGTVIIGHADPSGPRGPDGEGRRRDEDDVPEDIVVMRRGENPLEVCQRIEKMADQINEHYLPPGVKLVDVLRPHRPDRAHPAHRGPQHDRRHRAGAAGA